MFLKREIRIGAAVALVAVLALVLPAPAGAVGREETWDWSDRLVVRVLSWLGLGSDSVISSKCEDGSQIDPNGCPRAKAPRGSTQAKDGSQIDPDGHR